MIFKAIQIETKRPDQRNISVEWNLKHGIAIKNFREFCGPRLTHAE